MALHASSAAATLPMLPPDYHHEVAQELVAFFHGFYRFGAAPTQFNLDDPQYLQMLHNMMFASLTIGAIVFIVLCIIVIRRTILHIRSSYARSLSMESSSIEISAVILLTVLAISSLSGLLGEAQVDYSAGVVRHAMTNTSRLFESSQRLAWDSVNTSQSIKMLADDLLVSFNDTDLPSDAFKMSGEAQILFHASKELYNATDKLLPKNYAEQAKDWEYSYFMLKSTTNFAILAVALASFLSISSIGWSMVTPLRLSIFIILSVVPISHTLIGVYLSSTMMTADFCSAPMNSTMTLLHTTATVNYYLECPANASNPFVSYTDRLDQTKRLVSDLQKTLEIYAQQHGDVGMHMKSSFLDPIGARLEELETQALSFNATQSCQNVSAGIEHALNAYCEYGMLGLFWMWVHQIILCLVLFIGVVTSVLVYERVHMREVRSEMRYQLLSTYEDDNMEHLELKARLKEEDAHNWQLHASDADTSAPSTQRPLRRVAGVDISFLKGSNEHACASIVVLDFSTLELLYEAFTYVSLPAPYIAGFLAFREVPALTKLYDDLLERCPELAPDIILVDGNGILHPLGFGLASHFGVLREIPTIGVGKTFLHVDGLTKGDAKRMMQEAKAAGEQLVKIRGASGRVWAAALCGPRGVQNPVYVSVGHHVTLDTAIAVVLACSKYRVPEPIRQADIRSREVIREWETTGVLNTTLDRFTIHR
ncbi:hypothetical protein P43SY_005465 [Pythium insidiosum]|uniref:Endonuclease V n=1 Tax=Pythium insidiosum TaxID=114742 RepID=A0AAD5LK07_PYTIN|nr:hypothetical protein P43SY_005465 [Pythium insidiosum]